MKKKIGIILLFVVLSIFAFCVLKSEDKGDDWDIPVSEIALVYISEGKVNGGLYFITEEEGIKLVNAFNAVRKEDIYWDLVNDEGLYGPAYGNVVVMLNNGERIRIGINPFGWIDYQGFHYYTNFQIEYYDVIRELQVKYGFQYEDIEKGILMQTDYGVMWYCKENIIVSLSCKLNDALRTMGFEYRVDNEITFGDLLSPYENLKLNDVVELEEWTIKVIEVKDENRITGLAVRFRGDQTSEK